jgi:hypothetical protein
MSLTLAEWRAQRAQTVEVELPSGLTVVVREVSVFDLVEQGKIPQTLAPQLEMFLKTDRKSSAMEMVGKLGELITLVCQACLVEPAELLVTELPFADRLALFSWLNRDAQSAASFRVKENGALAAGRNGDAVRGASE